MKQIGLLLLFSNLCIVAFAQNKTLTDDGAWCWFSAPSAIYLHGENDGDVITGWVTQDGSIDCSVLDINSKKKNTIVVDKTFNKDDHANPSFLELTNQEVLMTYTKHSDKVVRLNLVSITDNAPVVETKLQHDILDPKQLELYPRKCVTYANPVQLKAENDRIYCFGRWTGFKPNLMWSDDNGKSYTKSKVFITNKPFHGGNRPYVRYYSDGDSRIHILFTDGHPRNEALNSVYYVYYEAGAFYKADDSKICTIDQLPFEPKDASCIYRATKETGRAWVHDIVTDKKGNPCILYARYPSEKEHLYHYTRLVKGEWIDNLVCNSGKWFPQTPTGKKEVEPHYSGGMCLNPSNPSEIYVSRTIDGIFEIEQMKTKNYGETWKSTPITSNSKYDNVRPVFPKNYKKGDKEMVLWMVNEKYVHYTNYKTRIDYKIL